MRWRRGWLGRRWRERGGERGWGEKEGGRRKERDGVGVILGIELWKVKGKGRKVRMGEDLCWVVENCSRWLVGSFRLARYPMVWVTNSAITGHQIIYATGCRNMDRHTIDRLDMYDLGSKRSRLCPFTYSTRVP